MLMERDDCILKELEKVCSGMEMIESRVSQLEGERQRTSLTQSAKKHRPTEPHEMQRDWADIDPFYFMNVVIFQFILKGMSRLFII